MNTKNNNVKKQILNEFLKNLFIVSDKDYQKRVWIDGRGPEVHSFDEAVCDFFDLGEYIFAHPQSYNLTDEQFSLLTKFRKRFQDFSNDNDFPEEFINTPEWNEITQMAKEVLKAFHYQKWH